MELPFVNVFCAQTSTQRSASPLGRLWFSLCRCAKSEESRKRDLPFASLTQMLACRLSRPQPTATRHEPTPASANRQPTNALMHGANQPTLCMGLTNQRSHAWGYGDLRRGVRSTHPRLLLRRVQRKLPLPVLPAPPRKVRKAQY